MESVFCPTIIGQDREKPELPNHVEDNRTWACNKIYVNCLFDHMEGSYEKIEADLEYSLVLNIIFLKFKPRSREWDSEKSSLSLDIESQKISVSVLTLRLREIQSWSWSRYCDPDKFSLGSNMTLTKVQSWSRSRHWNWHKLSFGLKKPNQVSLLSGQSQVMYILLVMRIIDIK